MAMVIPSLPWLAEDDVNYLLQLYWKRSQTMDWSPGRTWGVKFTQTKPQGLGKSGWAMAFKKEKACL